jgi:hypothetical protein
VIIDPDFPDHWKTQILINELNQDAAPLYLIRLWAHCQNRRAWEFENIPAEALKAICRYKGDCKEIEAALINSGFIARSQNGLLSVLSWDEYNASLIKNWRNGSLGGRPKRKTQAEPNGNPTKTQPKSKHNPTETQAKPARNPCETDRIGLDRIGLDEIRLDKIGLEKAAERPLVFPEILDKEDFKDKWGEYIDYRRKSKLRKLNHVSVVKQLDNLASWGKDKAIEAINKTIANGWQGVFEPKEAQGRQSQISAINAAYNGGSAL